MTNKLSPLEAEQKKIARLVTKEFKQFYLTGGTALAFHFRHRISEDLDFFTQSYDRKKPKQIMDFIQQRTGFSFHLESEQKNPRMVPMQIYYLKLNQKQLLKIDFVRDLLKNIKPVRNGLHSVEDIYIRKIIAAVGMKDQESEIGRPLPSGRQSTKDLFDLYFLSSHYQPLPDFFLKHFSPSKAEVLIVWYRRFNRMDLKLELLDLVENVDTNKILKSMDEQILNQLPDKIS